MNFLEKKFSGLKKRLKSFSYGIVYLKNSDFAIPSWLYINGDRKELKFLNAKDDAFVYEFNEICLNDCYHLKKLKSKLTKVEVIVDIGANQGLFAIAARHNFSKATVNCYEPNKKLEIILGHNTIALNAQAYYEAVTKEDCKVQLHFGNTDLHTTTMVCDNGNVTGTSFRKVIDRAGGKIDILKMDCEGAEWDLLADATLWENIKSLTMEYHLWAKPDASVVQLFETLDNLKFSVLQHQPLSKNFGILTAIRKDI